MYFPFIVFFTVVIFFALVAAFSTWMYRDKSSLELSHIELLILSGNATLGQRISHFLLCIFTGLFYPLYIKTGIVINIIIIIVGYIIVGDLNWLF